MKHNLIIAIALCLALSLFVGWNYYKNEGRADKPIFITDTYSKNY